MIDHFWWFVAGSLLAEVLGTVGGFGSSVYFVPLAGYFLDFNSVLGITALYHLSSNLTKIAVFKKGLDTRLLIYLGIPAVVFVSLGAWLSKYVSAVFLTFLLGALLVLTSVFLLIRSNWKLDANKRNAIFGGGLSGLSAGLLGTGGAIRGITMAAFNLEKSAFIATSAVIDLAIDASRTVIYFLNGYIHTHDLYLVLVLLVVSVLGTLLGKWLLSLISQEVFRRIVLWLLLLIGIITLLRVL